MILKVGDLIKAEGSDVDLASYSALLLKFLKDIYHAEQEAKAENGESILESMKDALAKSLEQMMNEEQEGGE